MIFGTPGRFSLWRVSIIAASLSVAGLSTAVGQERSTLILTSTNDPANNAVVAFKLNTHGTVALAATQSIPTGAKGGASGNAGILQFEGNLGAVAIALVQKGSHCPDAVNPWQRAKHQNPIPATQHSSNRSRMPLGQKVNIHITIINNALFGSGYA